MARSEVRDDPVPAPSVRLPSLKEGEDMETFIVGFETALRLGEVPRGWWKREIATHIPMSVLTKVSDVVNEDGSSYEDIVGALRGSVSLSFGSAAEDLCTGERGKVYDMDVRSSLSRLKHLVKAVAGDACSVEEMAEALAVALARDHLVPQLKMVIDTGMRFKYREFIESCEQWERSQPRGTSCYKKSRPGFTAPVRSLGNNQANSGQPQGRARPTCFSCGKVGHLARECRSRPPGEAVTAPAAREVPAVPSGTRGSGTRVSTDVICFRCNKKGHKSPECPTRPKGNRRVQVPSRKTMKLQEEELFGRVNSCGLSVTIDTGAQISIVPLECVEQDQLMGRTMKVRSFQGAMVEGEACIVNFEFGGRKFEREAVAVAGNVINWTPCFQVSFSTGDDLDYLKELARHRRATLGDQLYVQPAMEKGKLQTGYVVSEHEMVEEKVHTPTDTLPVVGASKPVESESNEISVEEVMNDLSRIEIEGEEKRSSSDMEEDIGDHGQMEEAEREDGASVLDEESGEPLGGRAVGEDQLGCNVMGVGVPREALAKATAEDQSLQLARQLANLKSPVNRCVCLGCTGTNV